MAGPHLPLALRAGTPVPQPQRLTIQKRVIDQTGKFHSTHLMGRHGGWSEGLQQEHDSGKGNTRFNTREKVPNGEFALFGCRVSPPGNMVELESFKPWLRKVAEDV